MDSNTGMDGEDYDLYWETQRFFEAEELDSWGFEDALSGYYDSSSPDGGGGGGGGGTSSSGGNKTMAQERNRRKRLNDRLYALRSLVPSISKMDKVSIIKDAVDYIMQLQEQERKLSTEVSELEREETKALIINNVAAAELTTRKKRRILHSDSPIHVVEIKVREVGERTSVVSITCSKEEDTMVKLCDALESLHLKFLAATITSCSGNLLHTFCVETDETDGPRLKEKIEAAITAVDAPPSPMSF